MLGGNKADQPSDGNQDIQSLTIQVRIEAVHDASKRARLAFVVSIIASLAILITVWNAYYSYHRFLPFLNTFARSEVTNQTQKEALAEWVRSQTISVELLGIRIGIFDAALIGSLALFIITVWFYFSLRRVNRAIGFLLIDTKNERKEILKMIFHAVAASLVFVDMGLGDQPIDDLEDPPNTRKRPLYLRGVLKLLFFLPAITITVIIFSDFLSLLYLKAPFREDPTLLQSVKQQFSTHDVIRLILMELTAILLLFGTFILCLRSLQFEKATGDILNQYYQYLERNDAKKAQNER